MSASKLLNVKLIVVLLTVLLSATVFSQTIFDKNKGDHNNTKKGFMDGNLVGTVYYNFSEVGDYLNEKNRNGVWPKGTVHTYLDGVAIIVQAEAEGINGNKIHPLETNYYEFTRYNPSTGITYGWWALPNYANPYGSSPARSDDDFTSQKTWPDHWTDGPSDWDGYWNGYFGKVVKNADLEKYFVFDDNEDREYINKYNFFPDQDDLTRGGLGMQVKTRRFQWSNILATDVILWYYEITNIGTYGYNKILFAQYVDWGIGGANDNNGDYNELLDISYAWSVQPYGTPGNWGPVGVADYAFLENPRIPYDRKDNDKDGLTDKKRDNAPINFIDDLNKDPYLLDAFRDTTKFRTFYGYSWKPHCSILCDGKIVPSFIIPEKNENISEIIIALGELKYPLITKAGTKISNVNYSESGNKLSFTSKSFKSNPAVINLVSPMIPGEIKNNQNIVDSVETNYLKDGNYSIELKFTQADENNIDIFFK